MSSDRISTQRLVTMRRRALWVIVTCAVAVGAFALAWTVRPVDGPQHGRADSPPGAEVWARLTTRLASADARVAELEGDNTRCLKRMSRLDSCLAKQLECERAVKEGAARLTEAETARAGAINEKNRAAAKASESLSEAQVTSEKVAKLAAENSSLKRRIDDQLGKSRTDYDQLKRLLNKVCTECGVKCAKSCPR